MQVPIEKIKIKEGRRRLDTDHVRELADSIRELGLLNPVTIDSENTLIAGMHRLEAARQLGWSDVECTVSSLGGLQAELAEIDENFVRNDLSAVEYGDMLLRRKEIYEMLHPETKATYDGGPFRGNQHTDVVGDILSPTTKSFVQDTADRLGVVPRTVERQIRTARNLTPEAKEIIRDADAKLSKKTAMELSRLEPDQQREAAALLAAKEIRNVEEYKVKAAGSEPVHEPPAIDDPVHTESPKTGKELAEQGNAAAMPVSVVLPDMEPESKGATLTEIIAELKDPDKDCSGTPDSFLQEYDAFVRKFHRELDWYNDPYYDTVYPFLTGEQLTELRELTDSVRKSAEDFYKKVETAVKQKGTE